MHLGKRDVVICPEGLESVLLPDQTRAVAPDGFLCVQRSWTRGQSTGVSCLYRCSHESIFSSSLINPKLFLITLSICAVHACIYSSPGFPRWKYGSTFWTHTEVVIVRSDLSPCLPFSVHRQGTKSAFINMAACAHPNSQQNTT